MMAEWICNNPSLELLGNDGQNIVGQSVESRTHDSRGSLR